MTIKTDDLRDHTPTSRPRFPFGPTGRVEGRNVVTVTTPETRDHRGREEEQGDDNSLSPDDDEERPNEVGTNRKSRRPW